MTQVTAKCMLDAHPCSAVCLVSCSVSNKLRTPAGMLMGVHVFTY
jgi:hypothetical protein